METSNSTWKALCVVTGMLWLAALSVITLLGVYHGNHPEALHTYFSGCCLAVFYGAPLHALLMSGVVAAARSRGETVPVFGWWSCRMAWGLIGATILLLISEWYWR